jgi:hypothetical protein
VAAFAATLALCAALAPVQLPTGKIDAAAAAAAEAQQRDRPADTRTTAPEERSQDSGDEGGVPIWAGIGLILLAAVAGSLAARARNRRRMRQFSGH